MIKLSNAGQANLGQLTFQFFVRGQALPLLLKLDGWSPSGFYYPPTREEKERKERDEREKGKVSLHLQGVYGAIWLADGIGLDRSDATSMTGLGVRARYGFNRYIAFEGEVLGASTGSARFDDVTYNGTQGDLTRSGTLGRVQFGGVLRLGGDRFVPLARLGVGLQGAGHDARFTPAAGGAVQEPDMELSFDALWHFGAGMDVRLGDSLVAGFMASGIAISGDLQSIEAVLHLGYSWQP